MVLAVEEMRKTPGKSRSIRHLVSRFGELRCKDLRDKFYGLLSLVSEDHRFVTVDYRRSFLDIFFQVLMGSLYPDHMIGYRPSIQQSWSHCDIISRGRTLLVGLGLYEEPSLAVLDEASENQSLTFHLELEMVMEDHFLPYNFSNTSQQHYLWPTRATEDLPLGINYPCKGDLVYCITPKRAANPAGSGSKWIQKIFIRPEPSELRVIGFVLVGRSVSKQEEEEAVKVAFSLNEFQLCSIGQTQTDNQPRKLQMHISSASLIAAMTLFNFSKVWTSCRPKRLCNCS